MDTSDIIVSVCSAVITAILFGCWNWFRKYWKKDLRERQLYRMKTDCIITGLRNVNHGFGEQFGAAYDEAFEQMKADKNFVES